MKFPFTVLSALLCALSLAAQPPVRHGVPTDSIWLSDPAVVADPATGLYYMTGTSGLLWKSADLRTWDGPFSVVRPDPASWTGSHPEIWAAEIHPCNGRWYWFGTFTNNALRIARNQEGEIPRRATHILVADSPAGPFRPIPGSAEAYLPPQRATLDGTFWVDADSRPYMVFCGEWLMNQNGTVEAVELSPSLDRPVGEPFLLFRASDSPWSRDTRGGVETFNRVTDGPWLFRTGTGRLGMLWTSWVHDVYTTGVAYSESGTLRGPWVQQPDPILPPGYGHAMIFTDLQGRRVLSAHRHTKVDGRVDRRPAFWLVDLSGPELRLGSRIP